MICRVGWDRGLGYSRGPHSSRFREFRRLFHQSIGPRASQDARILAMQEEETHQLLLRFLRDPRNFYRHPRQYVLTLRAYASECLEPFVDMATMSCLARPWHRSPRSTGALILRLAYGYEVANDLDQEADPLVKAVEVAMQGFAKASEPGAFWVDYFPILRYVPEWVLPGGGFKALARRMRRELDEMYDLPYAFVKERMVGAMSSVFPC